MATFRVWYRDGSARLVTARTEVDARRQAKELAELDALDLSHAYERIRKVNSERAREIEREWQGRTVVKSVERLT